MPYAYNAILLTFYVFYRRSICMAAFFCNCSRFSSRQFFRVFFLETIFKRSHISVSSNCHVHNAVEAIQFVNRKFNLFKSVRRKNFQNLPFQHRQPLGVTYPDTSRCSKGDGHFSKNFKRPKTIRVSKLKVHNSLYKLADPEKLKKTEYHPALYVHR